METVFCHSILYFDICWIKFYNDDGKYIILWGYETYMEQASKGKKKTIFKRWWFWVIVVIIVIGAIGSGGRKDDSIPTTKPTTNQTVDNKSTDKPAENNSSKKEPDTKITYDNFTKIKMGMKYEDVIAILGEGTQQSSSEVSGIKTALYMWNGSGISNMNITIQNGVVTGKAQAGLQAMDAKITLDMFNQIKEGMTYKQVKAILGEGQLVSQTKIMDIESVMYEWINKDGSNMNGTFSGDKLQMKSQFGLK